MDNDLWLWLYTIKSNYWSNLEDMSGPTLDRLLELGWVKPLKTGSISPFLSLDLSEEGKRALEGVPSIPLFVEYSEDPVTTREAQDDGGWDQGDTDLNGRYVGTGLEVDGYMHKVTRTNGLPGQEVFVVWSNYATGSTFGRSEGRFAVEGVAHTQAGVDMLKKLAKTTHYDYFGGWEDSYDERFTL